MDLTSTLEAILFWKAEPVSIRALAELSGSDVDAVRTALDKLSVSLEGRGLALVRTADEATLGTSPAAAPIIEKLAKDEVSRDLGKAGLETLAIILYQGPISRADIDYIRGVNSQFIVRNLLVRGLIERVDNPADTRSFLYRTTTDLLSHLGLSSIENLPEYEQVRKDIEAFKQAK